MWVGEPPKLLNLFNHFEDHNPFELEDGMRALMEEATSLGMLTEFNLISEPVTPSLPTRERERGGEALFVNSIRHLRKYAKESRGSLKSLEEIRSICAYIGGTRCKPQRVIFPKRHII